MKKFSLIISILFVVLTFVGAGYVLFHYGNVNAGYAVIPMVFAITNTSLYINIIKKESK